MAPPITIIKPTIMKIVTCDFLFVFIFPYPALSILFKSDSWEPFILFAPVWFIGITAAVDSGFLSGNLKFKVLALLIIVESLAKFAIAFIFVETNNSHLVYASTPIAMAIAFLVGWLFVIFIKQPKKIIQVSLEFHILTRHK